MEWIASTFWNFFMTHKNLLDSVVWLHTGHCLELASGHFRNGTFSVTVSVLFMRVQHLPVSPLHNNETQINIQCVCCSTVDSAVDSQLEGLPSRHLCILVSSYYPKTYINHELPLGVRVNIVCALWWTETCPGCIPYLQTPVTPLDTRHWVEGHLIYCLRAKCVYIFYSSFLILWIITVMFWLFRYWSRQPLMP